MARTIVIGLVCLSVSAGWALADETPARQPSAESAASVGELVQQLDSDKYAEREAATQKLIALGKQAISAASAATKSTSSEVSKRAFEVLRQLASSDDEKTADLAKAALKKLAEDKDPHVARRAAGVLHPPADRQAAVPNVPLIPRGIQIVPPGGFQIPPPAGGFGAQIQIQAGVAGGGANVKIVQAQIVNGAQKIHVQDGDKKIDIDDDPQGGIKIQVTETENGKQKVSRYEAKNLDELKKKHPEGAKLYEEYAGKQNGIQVQVQQLQPGLPIPPGIPVPALQPDATKKARAAVAAARKQLDEALQAIQGTESADAEALKKLRQQIDEARQHLADAEKALGN